MNSWRFYSAMLTSLELSLALCFVEVVLPIQEETKWLAKNAEEKPEELRSMTDIS